MQSRSAKAGGRYPGWRALVIKNLETKKRLSRRFEDAVTETPVGKYAAVFLTNKQLGPIDGLFAAFDLTGVIPRV